MIHKHIIFWAMVALAGFGCQTTSTTHHDQVDARITEPGRYALDGPHRPHCSVEVQPLAEGHVHRGEAFADGRGAGTLRATR